MRYPLALAALAASAVLAACNGGGAAPPPFNTGSTPAPTATPTAAPKVILAEWRGAAHPAGARFTYSGARSPRDVATATPYPVLIAPCDPNVETCVSADTRAAADAQQVPASAAPSSSPSPAPTPAWTVNSAQVALAPVNASSGGAYAGAQVFVGAPSSSAPGTYAATATFPDSASTTLGVRVYQHPTFGRGFAPMTSTTLPAGWAFASNAGADAAHADVWVDATGTIRCAHGCRVVMNGDPGTAEPAFVNATSTDFASVSPATWAADFSSLTIADYMTIQGTAILLVKGADNAAIDKLLITYASVSNGGGSSTVSGLGLGASGASAFAF